MNILGIVRAKHSVQLPLWALAVCMALPVSSRGATESVTESFVSTATYIPGTAGIGSRISSFSLQLVNPVLYGGAVTTVSPTNISDSKAVWTDNQYNGTNGSFYLEFISGVTADIVKT